MPLLDERLATGSTGYAVSLLHAALRRLNAALVVEEFGKYDIPPKELAESRFGEGTARALGQFQVDQGGEATAVLDPDTARLINARLKEVGPLDYRVHGTVRDTAGQVVPGLQVLALARGNNWQRDEPLAAPTTTNADGNYSIAFPTDLFFAPIPGGPALLVQARDAQGKVLATSDPLADPKLEQEIDLTVPAVDQSEYVVRGQVRGADGLPLAGIEVKAYDADLPSLNRDQFLNNATTAADGDYAIFYAAASFARAEKDTADLKVQALDGQGAVIASAPILFNAPREARVDLTATKVSGPSEFERLRQAIPPLTADVPITDVSEEDTAFLAGETGFERHHVELFVAAHSHMRTSEKKIEAAAFYGLMRERLPVELTALLMQSQSAIRHALKLAATENIIPPSFGAMADAIVEQLRALAITVALTPREDGRGLAHLLGPALPEAAQQAAFLSAYAHHRGTIEEFWQNLRGDEVLKDHVDLLQFSLGAALVGANHPPLVKALADKRVAGELASLVDLARYDREDWRRMLAEPGPDGPIGTPPGVAGKDPSEKIANYTQVITERVEDAFPMPFLRQRLQADELPGKQDLVAFFADNADFDLRWTRIEAYAREKPQAFDKVSDSNGTQAQLKAMQRLYRVAPRYGQMSALLKDGIGSALAIDRMDRGTFIARYAGPFESSSAASRAHENASQLSATVVNLIASYAPLGGRRGMHAVPDDPVREVEGVPEWATLFGSIELCDCQHCRSVYSPAAYLVDVLHFLRDRAALPPHGTALAALLARRPDLGEIELTCENTNTPVPYVDLVNEVLEDAIAPPPPFAPFDLDPARRADLDRPRPSPALRAAFDPPLSAGAVVTPGAHASSSSSVQAWWRVDEPAFGYTVHAEPGGRLRVASCSRQTAGTAEERAAGPQYINRRAYDEVLSRAVFPWSLPFELGAETARVHLEHLGTKRHVVMEAFRADERSALLADPAVARAHLGVGAKDAAIIGGTAPEPLWQQWGFPAETLDAAHTLQDPSNRTARIAAGRWIDVLSGRIDVVLQQSGLSYLELLECLQTHGVNPQIGGARALQIAGPAGRDADTCATKLLRVVGFDAGAAAGLMRFVRLQRRLGWAARELDRALLAFGPPDAGGARSALDDSAILVKLSHVQRLGESTGLPPLRILAWWAPAGSTFWTATYADPPERGAYVQVLRGRAPALDSAGALSEHPSDLSGSIGAAAAAVAAALGITALDLARLADATPLLPAAPAAPLDAPLNLENLIRLHRHAALARSVGLTIPDYLTLLTLVATDPFADTTACLAFVEQVGLLHATTLSVVEIDYVLRHRTAAGDGVTPPTETVAARLTELRGELQKIAATNQLPAAVSDSGVADVDPTGDLLRRKLALLGWEPALIDRSIAALSATDDLGAAIAAAARAFKHFAHDYAVPLAAVPASLRFPRGLAARVFYDAAAQPSQLRFRGVMTADERDVLLALATDPADPNHLAYGDAVRALFDQPTSDPDNLFLSSGRPDSDIAVMFRDGGKPAERFGRVLVRLLPRLTRSLSELLVAQRLASLFGLDARTGALLGRHLTSSTRAPGRHVIDDFFDDTFVNSHPALPVTAAAFPAAFKTYARLHKIALLATRLKLSAVQLGWLLGDSTGGRWPDLGSLPASADDTSWGVDALLRLTALASLRDHLQGGETTLDQLFRAAREGMSAADLVKRAASLTGWSEHELAFLAEPQIFDLTRPDAFRDERELVRLQACFALMKRTGMSAALCRELSADVVDVATGQRVVQAARARSMETEWLQAARPLRDTLRELQRSALTAYLVGHPPGDQHWRGTDDLYARFLIDVEMAPCTLTSRIKQAIGSAQLFVQRCMMNLMPDEVQADERTDGRWHEWRWMKNYRVWEANRKVFLYPENWLAPDLRDDKSPFFRALESELLQGEVTSERAEAAYRHYLERLDEVSRLAVVGTFRQLERDIYGNTAVDILHVVARSAADPPTYYYRQRVDSSYWTAWEKIDADVRGDHLIPVVWQRRLFLFWALFARKPRIFDPQMRDGNLTSPPPQDFHEVQLAWTERRNGRWTAKKLTQQLLTTERNRWFRQPQNVSFQVNFEEDGVLSIVACTEVNNSIEVTVPRAFRFSGVGSDAAVVPAAARAPRLTGADHYGMQLIGRTLESDNQEDRPFVSELYLPAPFDTPALAIAPSPYCIVYQHQGRTIAGNPFFVSNHQPWHLPAGVPPGSLRTFVVTPKEQSPAALRANYLLDPDPSLLSLASALDRPSEPPPELALSPGLSIPSLPVVTGIGPEPPSGPSGTTSPILVGLIFAPFMARRTESRYRFHTFYHPHVQAFIHQLNRDGIDGLLQREVQLRPAQFLPRLPGGATVPLDFQREYQPDQVERPIVDPRYPTEDLDFGMEGAYSLYNWELFFHIPFLIAERLSKNQRFAEAQNWLHYVFNPTDTSGLRAPGRYWQMRKFHLTTDSEYAQRQIQRVLSLLAEGGDPARRASLAPDDLSELERLEAAVRDWRKSPFRPHAVARMRTVAYQKAVVMAYLDNLIAWGDQLFRRDTIEAMNEAAQLYVLAAEILGRRPEKVPSRAVAAPQTFNALATRLDAFSNALVEMEALVSPPAAGGTVHPGRAPAMTLPAMLYFCVPQNDRLLGYWDTVADRLFKLRHCMNIAGVVRQLPLFGPPIDPALLARAEAAGVDLGSALADTGAALPSYRFTVLAARATELVGEVKALGASLLGVLEKGDAEAMSMLRARHEKALLAKIEETRNKQSDEAAKNFEALVKSRELSVARYVYYQKLLGNAGVTAPARDATIPDQDYPSWATTLAEDGVRLIQHEKNEQTALSDARWAQVLAGGNDAAVALMHLIPTVHASPWGVGASVGGSNFGHSLAAISAGLRLAASQSSHEAGRSARMGQFVMREHEWALQSNLAVREIMQVDKQIAASRIRSEIAQRELDSHRMQIAHSNEVEAFFEEKYTNEELYTWMTDRVADVYFRAYQLAYDMAKRAERGFCFELGLKGANFIQFGYWDNIKKGLLAGDGLAHDLKRMEMAYLDGNRRDHEITKHVSLVLHDPLQLITLKTTGSCTVSLPEALFDADYPGHYLRRLKSVSLTIPAVVGPYASVNCTLTLQRSKIRMTGAAAGSYVERQDGEDNRFVTDFAPQQSIATSHAQNDSGLFELNFRDERFLPFENAGAVSEWRIDMPRDTNAFDFDTITDVVLRLNYTARDGGEGLRKAARDALRISDHSRVPPSATQRLFSLRHEFAVEWGRFLQQLDSPRADFSLAPERLPFVLRGRAVTIRQLDVFWLTKSDGDVAPAHIDLYSPRNTTISGALQNWPAGAQAVQSTVFHAAFAFDGDGEPTGAPRDGTQSYIWSLVPEGPVDPSKIEDILIICNFGS